MSLSSSCSTPAIAACFLPLDPFTNSNTIIAYQATTTLFSIHYHEIPINITAFINTFNLSRSSFIPPTLSFQLTLFATGRISIRYFQVTDPLTLTALVAPFNSWLVGLLNYAYSIDTVTFSSPRPSNLNSSSIRIGIGNMAQELTWRPTSVPTGIYTDRQQIQNHTQLIACAIGGNAHIFNIIT